MQKKKKRSRRMYGKGQSEIFPFTFIKHAVMNGKSHVRKDAKRIAVFRDHFFFRSQNPSYSGRSKTAMAVILHFPTFSSMPLYIQLI